MKKNFSDYLISIVVIACSGVLLAALTYALAGWNAGPSGRSLLVDFPDITGIKIHSEVRYAGAPAGRVAEIRYLAPEERAPVEEGKRFNTVRVTLALRDDLPGIPADTKVTLAADTLLSEKFVALSGGSPNQPLLEDGTRLQGLTGGSIDELLADLGPFFKNVDKTVLSIETVVKKAGDTLETLQGGLKEVLPKVGNVADSAKITAESADSLMKRADKLIADNEKEVKANLLELREALQKLQGTLTTADGFVGRTDRQLGARMQELGVVLQNLKVITTHAKGITETLGERPSRLFWGSKKKELPSEEEILRSKQPVPLPNKPKPKAR